MSDPRPLPFLGPADGLDKLVAARARMRRFGPCLGSRYSDRMPSETLEVRDNPERHRFEIDLGDGSSAFAEYTLPAGKIMFTHTEVPPSHEGQGLGTTLIEAALAAARERGLQVIPICPFVARYMAEHAEVQDLLDPAWRKRFGLD